MNIYAGSHSSLVQPIPPYYYGTTRITLKMQVQGVVQGVQGVITIFILALGIVRAYSMGGL